uniref:CAZy families CE9 protein n=1 Tax=uncultured Bifidobacterium sp. TaxID=165187 RepID=A0A060CSA1_9BIFI|nr:CAZy families CE9 protein [uncultured Bifidobacterium sp.]
MSGYIDIHSHGGGGFTFGVSVEESIGAARAQHAHGTVAIIGSLVTSPVLTLEQQLGIMREAMAAEPLIVGAHLEDPFLAPERKGAHAPELLEVPSPARVDDLIAAGEGVLRQITIAPELPGALEAIATFRRRA